MALRESKQAAEAGFWIPSQVSIPHPPVNGGIKQAYRGFPWNSYVFRPGINLVFPPIVRIRDS